MAREFKFDIKEHIGVITSTIRGRREGDAWQKEINIVSWNGGLPKIDIRDWTEDHERMSKGITLTEAEAREVMEILQMYFADKETEEVKGLIRGCFADKETE